MKQKLLYVFALVMGLTIGIACGGIDDTDQSALVGETQQALDCGLESYVAVPNTTATDAWCDEVCTMPTPFCPASLCMCSGSSVVAGTTGCEVYVHRVYPQWNGWCQSNCEAGFCPSFCEEDCGF